MRFFLFFLSFLSAQHLISQHFSAEDQITIDSLNQIITNSESHDTSLAAAYLGLSEVLYIANLDTIIHLCERALEISEKALAKKTIFQVKQNLLKCRAGALNNIGYVYKVRGDMNKALEYYLKSLQVDEELGNSKGVAVSLNNIGVIYDGQGDIPKALEYYHKSLRIKEDLGDKRGISNSLNNIGLLYERQQDLIKALEYYDRSLILNEEIRDKKGVARSLNNIGSISKAQKDFTKALEYYQKSLKVRKEIGDKIGVATSISNIGNIYDYQNDYPNALEYYRKALSIKQGMGDKSGSSAILHNIGAILLKSGDFSMAQNYAQQSFDLANEIGYPELIRNSSELLSKVFDKRQNDSKAFEMYKLFITMRDSIYNIETQKTAIEEKLKYEFDKKEALAGVEHEKEIAIATAESNKQKVIIWAVSIGLLLIVVFSFIIWNRLRISNTQKQIIQTKNTENELLLGEIHHRVKNNLQVISSLLSLQERNTTDKTTKAAILDGKERVQSMGLIHNMLYQQNNFSGINMSEYIEKLIAGLLDSFGKKPEDFELKYDIKNINLDVDTAIPLGLIINELVVNSLKHAYSVTEEPKINVNLQEINNQLVLEVEDNGVGEVADVQSSESFGMKLVNSLSRQLRGTIDIEQRGGLCFKISINDYKLIA